MHHAGEALALGRAQGVLLDPATEQRGAAGVGGGEEEGLDAVGQVRRAKAALSTTASTHAARLSGCGSGVRCAQGCASRSIAPSCSGRHAHRGLNRGPSSRQGAVQPPCRHGSSNAHAPHVRAHRACQEANFDVVEGILFASAPSSNGKRRVV